MSLNIRDFNKRTFNELNRRGSMTEAEREAEDRAAHEALYDGHAEEYQSLRQRNAFCWDYDPKPGKDLGAFPYKSDIVYCLHWARLVMLRTDCEVEIYSHTAHGQTPQPIHDYGKASVTGDRVYVWRPGINKQGEEVEQEFNMQIDDFLHAGWSVCSHGKNESRIKESLYNPFNTGLPDFDRGLYTIVERPEFVFKLHSSMAKSLGDYIQEKIRESGKTKKDFQCEHTKENDAE